MRKTALLILSVSLLTAGLLAQNPNLPVFPNSIAQDKHLLVAVDSSMSVLAANINQTTLSIPVADGTKFRAYQVVRIDNESILICSVNGNILNVCNDGRGFGGSTPAIHGAGAEVKGLIYAWHHNQLAAEIKAIQQALGVNLSSVAPAQHNHDAQNITSGTLPVSRGGTGASTPEGARQALSTGYVRVQANPPASCSVGDLWFDSDATPGKNWFGCTAANTWTLLGSSSIEWGSITGTLSNQTDLQAALDGKANATHNHDSTYQALNQKNQPNGYAGLDGSGKLSASQVPDLSSVYQPLDSDLTVIAGLSCSSGQIIKRNASGLWECANDATGGSPTWGSITGTLSNQTDLQAALDGKANATHNHDSTYQALSQKNQAYGYAGLDASGLLAVSQIPGLPASKITSGQLSTAYGGTGRGVTWTPGSMLFINSSNVFEQDNANLFWDNTNKRLGIATNAPTTSLDVNGIVRARNGFRISSSPAAGTYLRSNGSEFVESSIQASDLPDLSETYQPKDSDLTAIAGLSCSNGQVIKLSSGAWACGTDEQGVTSVSGTSNEITSSGGATPTLSIADTFRITGKTATAPVKAATSLPATCAIGDLFFKTDATAGQNMYGCTATNTWTLLGDGGGGSSEPSINTSIIQDFEEWLSHGNNATAPVGRLGWTVNMDNGSGAATAGYESYSSYNLIGVAEMAPAGVNARVTLHLGAYGMGYRWFAAAINSWEYQFVVRTDNYENTQVSYIVGLADAVSQQPSNGIWVRYRNNTGCTVTGSDSGWVYETRSSGASTTQASGMSVSTATVYRIRIRKSGSGVGFSMCSGGPTCTLGSETVITTNIPTANLSPYIQSVSCGAGYHKLFADRFDVLIQR